MSLAPGQRGSTPRTPVEQEVEYLRDFFDHAPDMFVSVDAATACVRWCNPTLCRRLDREREDIVGKPLKELFHPKSIAAITALLTDFHDAGTASHDSIDLCDAWGNAVEVSLRVSAIRDERGDILGSRLILREVTPPREIPDQPNGATADRMESLALLAGSIAHEFNNLLTAVQGNVDLALLQVLPSSPVWSSLRDIEVAARRGAEFTDRLLAFAGQIDLEIANVSLSTVVREIAGLLRVTAQPGVEFRLELSDPGPTVRADLTKLRQLVMYLIVNGTDALGEKGGTIRIGTGSMEASAQDLDHMLQPADAEPGAFGWLEIADTGIGMTPENLGRMFEPQFTTKGQGRGLSLAAILGVTRRCRGAIDVTSEHGVGTTVRVLFRVADAPQQRPAPGAATIPPARSETEVHSRRALVLVADDEDHVRAVMQGMLIKAGYGVVTAADGQEAVDLYLQRSKDIDLVVLDGSMPRKGGLEAIDEILAHEPSARIILMSGDSKSELQAEKQIPHPIGFLRKPFGMQALLKLVREFTATR